MKKELQETFKKSFIKKKERAIVLSFDVDGREIRFEFYDSDLKLINEILEECYDMGAELQKKEDLKRIKKWWDSDEVCSGKPHCDIDKCDLCITCYEKLIKQIKEGK